MSVLYNSQDIEKKWQKKWKDAKLFEADPIEGIEKKFLTVPYPYVSGPLHIGHGRSYINGDIFARYYRAKGYNVLFPMAFHITGTPILAISFGIEMNESKVINRMKEYVSIYEEDENHLEKIVRSFSNPKNIVEYFSEKIKDDFQSIGLSVDWRREFTTGDKHYNKFIEWQFNTFYEKGYIEKGQYPILHCPNCSNAVGEDDIQSGDELNLDIREYSCIKFPFREGYLVASTLRPETLFGVTNIWINPDEEYVKVLVDDEIWIVSKMAVTKLENQAKKVKVKDQFQGKELVGEKIPSIYNSHKIPILPGYFVDVSTATGVVYSVPAHAPYDYIALEDLKKNRGLIEKFNLNFDEIQKIEPLKIIATEDIEGIAAKEFCEKYKIKSQQNKEMLEIATNEIYKKEFYNGTLNENCGDFVGLEVENAVEKVKADLSDKKLIDRLYYHISKDLQCRCGADVMVSILEDQYFLNYNAGNWKEKAYECLNQMEILPKKYRTNFEKTFDWLDKRPCARRRGLGTKLPMNKEWIIESLSDSTIYMSFYTIIHVLKREKINSEQLIGEFFDYVFLNKGSIKIVSEKTRISEKILIDIQQEFSYWYPVDHRHTAIMHISNHLSFYIFHHVAIFPEKFWPKMISLIEPLIMEGQKMGKSKGNVISLAEIQEKYSTDLFRFFISHAADLGVKVDWREKRINAVRKHLKNFYKFINEFSNRLESAIKIDQIKSKYAQVILSKVLRAFEKSEKAISELNIRRYLQIGFYEVFNFLIDFRKFHTNLNEYISIVNYLIPLWLERLNPAIPHLTEELWMEYGNKDILSGRKWSKFDKSFINDKLETKFEYIKAIIEDILKIKKVLKINKVQKIHLYTSPEWKYELDILVQKYNGNLKKITENLTSSLKQIDNKELYPYLTKQIKKRQWDTLIGITDEIKILKEFQDYIEQKVRNKIIINSEFDPDNRSVKAEPLKPAVFIEK
ncbi:MAG: leucine--tRNA ligase [Promethearchaeota archaeon]|nr:MAG: leucine--tRNA ligase [Candidatus Lokiarchaeota archaeon]